MKSLVGGGALCLAGALCTWIGLALVLGWSQSPIGVAIAVIALGLTSIGLGGLVLRQNLARAFTLCGAACLLTAALVAVKVPGMVGTTGEADPVYLWSLMASGTMLFFGLAFLIGAAFTLLLLQDGP